MMDMLYKTPPKLLFLKNVTPDECTNIADVFEEQLMEDLKDEVQQQHIYDKIPSKFTTIDTWITKTNIRCHHCTLEHSNQPVFIPDRISSLDGSITPFKLFCSFSCASAAIPIYFPDRIWEVTEMLKILYERFYLRKITNIPRSPARDDMELYGGSTTVKEYVSIVDRLTKKIRDSSEPID